MTMGYGTVSKLSMLVGFSLLSLAGTHAWGFEGGSAVALGDQGSDFDLGQEFFLFPHKMLDARDRVVLQLTRDTSAQVVSGYAPFGVGSILAYGDVPQGDLLLSSTADEMANGVGLIVSLLDSLKFGAWFSQYGADLGGFVDRGMGNTGWDVFVGVPAGGMGDLSSAVVDPYVAGIDATRRLDLLAGYRATSLDLDVGLRFFWGVGGASRLPDDSIGPIDVSPDSTSDNGSLAYDVQEGSYGVSDLGVGLSVGYGGLSGWRFDGALQASMRGSEYSPNNLGSFYDLSGIGLRAKFRMMIELASRLDVGGSLSYASERSSFTPLMQRDGGALPSVYTDLDDPAALEDPGTGENTLLGNAGPSGDPNMDSNELRPVAGTAYNESRGQWTVALLAKYRPIASVALYGALGFEHVSASRGVDVASVWTDEESANLVAMPFVRMGLQGGVTDWFDIMFGAVVRSFRWDHTDRNYDGRIPDDEFYQGGLDVGLVGTEDATNHNRREVVTERSLSGASTQFMLGMRLYGDSFSFLAHLNPDALFNGAFLFFGQANIQNTRKPLLWVSLAYDWGQSPAAPLTAYRSMTGKESDRDQPELVDDASSGTFRPVQRSSGKSAIPSHRVGGRQSDSRRRPITSTRDDEEY